ncbi:hypothetical protein [Massilia cavernae]|uniref:hypothetical protein n=1 Tax=Massilia cavernae TaxID=2320864 RepID=UPI0011C4A4A7|nr:hypothetical protein [Massilia cavernae]
MLVLSWSGHRVGVSREKFAQAKYRAPSVFEYKNWPVLAGPSHEIGYRCMENGQCVLVERYINRVGMLVIDFIQQTMPPTWSVGEPLWAQQQ